MAFGDTGPTKPVDFFISHTSADRVWAVVFDPSGGRLVSASAALPDGWAALAADEPF